MTFDEWLGTPKGKELFISKDSKPYKQYKMIWDEAFKNIPPKEVIIEKEVIKEVIIKDVPKKNSGKKE